MSQIGVLLVNLGTPDSPEPNDVYRYLNQFLTDGRVIDIPWPIRQALVRGRIVPRRYKKSAAMYHQVWTEEGSPLMVHGERVAEALQNELGEEYSVRLAMRYQQPSIGLALARFLESGISKLLVLPLFPQYASATTGSIHQKVMEIVKDWQVIPELTMVSSFATDPLMIEAFAEIASTYALDSYDHILFSFHGLPKRQLKKADRRAHCLEKVNCCATLTGQNRHCYSAQCHATGQAIAKRLDLKEEQFSICFQSRLGKEPWIGPYASDVIQERLSVGNKRILVFCPAFVCDCLETIFEIGVEYAKEFKEGGGEQLDLVEGLNSHPAWITALKGLVKRHAPAEELACLQ